MLLNSSCGCYEICLYDGNTNRNLCSNLSRRSSPLEHNHFLLALGIQSGALFQSMDLLHALQSSGRRRFDADIAPAYIEPMSNIMQKPLRTNLLFTPNPLTHVSTREDCN